jgi:hypothetical protein
MKKLFTLFVMVAMTFSVFAQSPQKMNYQCVIRNASGVLVANQSVGMKISILQTTSTGTVVYQETYNPNPQTNANGLLTLEIGSGLVITGTFSTINWSAGPYFLKTETDPTGGTNYTISGTSQLLSVPYAMFSKTAQTADYNNLTNLPNLSGYVTSESDPVFVASPAHGITNGNITNWNNAYGWGNHAGLYRSISWVPAWTDVSGKPTSITGYGITDAVTITSNQTITGIKTFSNDLLINGLTVGLGKGAVSTNTAVGYQALYSNTTGYSNTANGYQALATNSTGYLNTANGFDALFSNTTGSANTANGYYALYYTIGGWNTANGSYALYHNTTGSTNTADGEEALYNNTTGYQNTAIGETALYSNTTGSNNTAIGYDATVASGDLTNATAIGSYAAVNASNKVRIGNANVTVIEGQVNWSVGSDRRLKDNIEYSDKLGLEFVNGLKTVTFTYKNDLTKKHHNGLIAQDVNELLEKLRQNFSGLVESDNEEKTLNLSYAEFVVPLINAVKELSKQNLIDQQQIESTKQENLQLRSQLQSLQEKVDQIESLLTKSGMR